MSEDGQMDNLKLIAQEEMVLSIAHTVPETYQTTCINIHDIRTQDLLLHIDFRYPDNLVVINHCIEGQWDKEEHHWFEFKDGFTQGEIRFLAEGFEFTFGDLHMSIPKRKDHIGKTLKLYSNFRYISIGHSDTIRQTVAKAWPFFQDPPGAATSRLQLRRLISHEDRPAGLCGLVFYNGDPKQIMSFLEHSANRFDEVILVIHDAKALDLETIRNLQSRYYNVRYAVVDRLHSNAGDMNKLKNALFLNSALSHVKYSNVMLLGVEFPDAESLTELIAKHRLRRRVDHFALFCDSKPQKSWRGKKDQPPGLAVFSLRSDTAFADSNETDANEKACLSRHDLATRRILVDESGNKFPNPAGDWSINMLHQLDLEATPLKSTAQVEIQDGWRGGKLNQTARGSLAILVVSCKKNRHRQEAIRQTWARDAMKANFELFFVEGDPSLDAPIIIGDRLHVPAHDTYEYLSHKIWHMFRAAKELLEADCFYKIDDDCICNVFRLMQFSYEAYDYIGTDISVGAHSITDWHFSAVSNTQLNDMIFHINEDQTWYDGQGGYIVSSEAAEGFSDIGLHDYQHMLEDYATGCIMAQAGHFAHLTVSNFSSIRHQYISKDIDYDRIVISDIGSAEEMVETYKLVDERNKGYMRENGGLKILV